MKTRLAQAINHWLSPYLPEKRLFLRSDTSTRFIRLSPGSQFLALMGCTAIIGWATFSTAVMLMDGIGSGNAAEQAKREQILYEERLSALAEDRDKRAEEAQEAHARFAGALEQISTMQNALLSSEDRRNELETGIEVIQATLRRTMQERDAARVRAASLQIGESAPEASAADAGTVDMLASVLAETASERDEATAHAQLALDEANDIRLELELLQEKNDQIFRQLEEAMLVSVEPIEKMFRSAGMNPDQLIREVRRGYSGTGGPLTPVSFSTRSGASAVEAERANNILQQMDRINLYRVAAEKVPFDMPVRSGYRFTSGFGPRWGRMHNGLDFAAPIGTPIYAPADGVVTFAGWSSGYGRLVKVQHAFGIETRYAHQSRMRVSVGQRLSRGDRIGDIGNSGRSTGPHLHYEIRVGGKPVNPMTYIRAGQDVF